MMAISMMGTTTPSSIFGRMLHGICFQRINRRSTRLIKSRTAATALQERGQQHYCYWYPKQEALQAPKRFRSSSSKRPDNEEELLMGKPLQKPAGPLFDNPSLANPGRRRRLDKDNESSSSKETNDEKDDDNSSTSIQGAESTSDPYFIPQVPLHLHCQQRRKRVLVLCTGGTLTMKPNDAGALAPVQGALTHYIKYEMQTELNMPSMPEVVVHEYEPIYDSSDLGPADWALLAKDIETNYYHFDGFVVLMGTDTMAYCSTALSFMLENLAKPVIFTGSQIPLWEPYNDGRRNLIMALLFAAREDYRPEVALFFHDRLLRACRSTKINTRGLFAFDSPNMEPLAKLGLTVIMDNQTSFLQQPLDPPRGPLRVHTRLDTRMLTLRLVPGFDDEMIARLVEQSTPNDDSNTTKPLRALVLQLYGTGNLPSVKESLLQILARATERGILVVALTQCMRGHVQLGQYASGQALLSRAGVVSAGDMTPEATAAKLGYLFGRGDLTREQIGSLMGVSLRGEVTPQSFFPFSLPLSGHPPPPRV